MRQLKAVTISIEQLQFFNVHFCEVFQIILVVLIHDHLGNNALADSLINRGANVNVAAENGKTVLHYAAMLSKLQISIIALSFNLNAHI